MIVPQRLKVKLWNQLTHEHDEVEVLDGSENPNFWNFWDILIHEPDVDHISEKTIKELAEYFDVSEEYAIKLVKRFEEI